MRLLLNIAFFLMLAINVGAGEISLDGMWRFRTDPYGMGVSGGWWKPAFDRSSWEMMKVPGNWDTTPAYALYMGTAWYATSFNVTPERNKIYRIRFEGVATDAEVWLNGTLLGTHDFAFTEFAFDVTSLLRHDTANELVVKVDNRFKVGATWNFGGIRRPVSLIELPAAGIDKIEVRSWTIPHAGTAEVTVTGVLRNAGQSAKANIEICDSTGAVVASREVKSKNGRVSCTFKLKDIELWHFDNPYLYTLRMSCVGDTAQSRFGLRDVRVDGERFLLNGEEVRLCGANWVPDDRFSGNTLPVWLYRRDIDMMKEAGVNMARLSHQGLPGEVLDYLDERGILIFEEIPLWNKNAMVTPRDPVPVRWLTELVEERINHPCIIGWSVGNEIGRHSDNPELEGYLRNAFDHIHTIDPGRLAVYVTHTAAKQPSEPAYLSDMILFNQYGAHGERADRVHEYNPGKPIFYSEYGKNVNRSDLDATVDYRSMLDDMGGRGFLAGASVWTFNDYRTNYRDKSTDASGNRPWGAVDAYRRKKRAYHQLRRANSPLAIFESVVDAPFCKVKLKPRGRYEIPSFTMSGYELRAEACDKSGIVRSSSMRLPVIAPGDDMMTENLDLEITPDTERLSISLISPIGYEIDRIEHRFVKPAKPEISAVETGDTHVRIHFSHDESASEYFAEYYEDGKMKRTSPTIEKYIDIPIAEFGKQQDIRLVAANESGETTSGPIRVGTEARILPPVILGAWTRGDELHVAFTSDMQDFYYDIEYGIDGGEMRRITVNNGGACVLPVIEPSKPHTVRINRHLAYGYASPMSVAVSSVVME